MSWNFGDILDGVGSVLPGDAPALIHGDRSVGWAEFSRLSNNLASQLRSRGARTGDKLALYMRNCPEFMLSLTACFKARLAPVNINFRYRDDELWYVFDNSDTRFVVFGAEFAERVEALRQRLPGVEGWIQVDGEPDSVAESFAAIASQGEGQPLELERSGDDLLLVYTGGTTGMPKGVMWRAEDLWGALGAGKNAPANRGQTPGSLSEHLENVKKFGPGPRQIPVCPLMHGTGLFSTLTSFTGGGTVVTLEAHSLDPEELWGVVERHRVSSLVIVGDAFAKPMLRALDESPGRWNIRSLKVILSSGVMWSPEVKRGLLKHHDGMLLADMFGSSEAVGFGSSRTRAQGEVQSASFEIGEHCKVFTEDHREVKPGSGERGFIARSGSIPLGYFKDPENSAKTFPIIDGVRYSIPGDWCMVKADGSLTLLGRGNACINTGGEKVYSEEVEEVLKTHPKVEDALVLGVPDEKWGQAVTAVVQLREGTSVDEAGLRAHVGQHLAGYKTPKRIAAVDAMFRTPSGKPDYKAATRYLEQLPETD
jgi:acyl-CoA synthetase (AMP-forming)/AMP-acid ligase II